MPGGKTWSGHEKDLLARGLPVPGRSYPARRRMRQVLRSQGIHVELLCVPYDAESDDFLRYHRRRGDVLPGRDRGSLVSRAMNLRKQGVDVPHISVPFTLEDCLTILDNPFMSHTELGELLNRNPGCILTKRRDLIDRVANGLPLVGKRANGTGKRFS